MCECSVRGARAVDMPLVSVCRSVVGSVLVNVSVSVILVSRLLLKVSLPSVG